MKGLRNPQRRPTHPGAILREDVLPALGMTQTQLAERLGVSRLSVSELLHEKRALSPEMAARIAKLLRTTPESWVRMQAAVDLWEIEQHPERLEAVTPIDKREMQEILNDRAGGHPASARMGRVNPAGPTTRFSPIACRGWQDRPRRAHAFTGRDVESWEANGQRLRWTL
jgi:addiction module HigA family antidote